MKVWIFQIKSFLAKGTNPRLPYYKRKLEEKGYEVDYHFLGDEKSSWLENGIQSVVYCFKIALGNKVDCLYIYGPNALFLPIYIAAKLRGTKIIVEKTELDSIRPDNGLKDQLVKWSYKIDEVLFPSFADGLVVITNLLQDHYDRKVKKIEVIPTFVDTQRFEYQDITPKTHRVSYLGTFGSKDDVEGIICAVEQAKNKIPELEFCTYGKGELAFDDIPTKLMESALLISNRTGSEYSKFGSPTKLVEYLASGVPVIATTSSDQLSILADGINYIYTEPGNTEALCDRIIARFENDEMHKGIGQAGRKSVIENHSVDLIMDRWYSFFENIA